MIDHDFPNFAIASITVEPSTHRPGTGPVMAVWLDGDKLWYVPEGENNPKYEYYYEPDRVLTARRLAIINPDLPVVKNFLKQYISGSPFSTTFQLAQMILAQRQVATPYMEEPTKIGTVVTANIRNSYPVGARTTLVRGGPYSLRPWHAGDLRFDWSDLESPALWTEEDAK